MSEGKRRRWHTYLWVMIATSLVAATSIIVWMNVQERRAVGASVYIYAAGSENRGTGRPEPRVSVWVNDRLRFRDVRGDKIPIILLQPGHYRIRVAARDYYPCTQAIDIDPFSTEAYVFCKLRIREYKRTRP
jgi:hypothetical protein